MILIRSKQTFHYNKKKAMNHEIMSKYMGFVGNLSKLDHTQFKGIIGYMCNVAKDCLRNCVMTVRDLQRSDVVVKVNL